VRYPFSRSSSLLAALLTVAGCSADRVTDPDPCPEQAVLGASFAVPEAVALPTSPFDALFEEAGRAYGVDPALLRSIAWVETRLHMVGGDERDEHDDHHGRPPAWGVMALRGERLARAAQLAGLSRDHVRHSPAANITAAAALLAAEARAAGVANRPAAEWAPAVARYTDIELPAGRTAYTHDVVTSTLPRAGARTSMTAGKAQAALAAAGPCDPPPPPPPPPPTSVTTVWRGSPNFNARAPGTSGQIAMIIIHTCEGAYTGCWSWLSNTVSGVSAHYVVNESGTEISYLVEEPLRAWHIGAVYDCTLNRARRCDLGGVQSNHFTIGVEHGGFASQTSFPDAQIDVSTRLVCEITQRHGIPRDGQHIVAHGQLQPYNRTDPGPNWPWIRYLALVQRHCGEVVVDDSDAFNDRTYARTTASPGWTSTSATPGYYGSGYSFASTAPDADAALVFEFYVGRAARYTVEARWTAGDNRSATAPFTIRNDTGAALATVTVDQRIDHDQWRPLATLDLAAGWHRVELSPRGAAGSVVIADAIRVR
jgi:N-acetyl-anhydromuramyl-L-alanine amidase AmpD